jgi:hypothetical protein
MSVVYQENPLFKSPTISLFHRLGNIITGMSLPVEAYKKIGDMDTQKYEKEIHDKAMEQIKMEEMKNSWIRDNKKSH